MRRSLTITLLLITVAVLSFLPSTITRNLDVKPYEVNSCDSVGYLATVYNLINGIDVAHIKGRFPQRSYEYVWIVVGGDTYEITIK
jgi:hypothetical protein